MMKLHSYRMDDATKLVLFKIMHLSIVVHYPTAHTAGTHTFSIDTTRSVPAINYVHDIHVWHKQLHSMHYIVESEIKESGKNIGRSQTEPSLCHTFVSMAAALCAVVCAWMIIDFEYAFRGNSLFLYHFARRCTGTTMSGRYQATSHK